MKRFDWDLTRWCQGYSLEAFTTSACAYDDYARLGVLHSTTYTVPSDDQELGENGNMLRASSSWDLDMAARALEYKYLLRWRYIIQIRSADSQRLRETRTA